MNNTSHKIYRCMPALSTQHYKLLHTPTILHKMTLFAPFCHLHKKILFEKKMSHSSLIHPLSPHTSLSTSNYDSNTNSSRNISLFPYLGLVLALRLRLRLRFRLRLCLQLWLWLWLQLWSIQPLTRNRHISLHATPQVADYFYFQVLCN